MNKIPCLSCGDTKSKTGINLDDGSFCCERCAKKQLDYQPRDSSLQSSNAIEALDWLFIDTGSESREKYETVKAALKDLNELAETVISLNKKLVSARVDIARLKKIVFATQNAAIDINKQLIEKEDKITKMKKIKCEDCSEWKDNYCEYFDTDDVKVSVCTAFDNKYGIKQLEDKITKLTELWYAYVNKGHHKDRDAHFYITRNWEYGELVKWKVEHYGYIGNMCQVFVDTYEEALEIMLREIKNMIKEEIKWAKEVMQPDLDYDKDQIDQAEWLIKNYKEEV